MDWGRLYRHAVGARRAHPLCTPDTMARLQAAIAAGESGHRGEIRLIVEASMPLRKVRRGLTTRQRALDLFGTFRVWDTEENNGVLVYVNLADRRIEVIADRAAARAIDPAVWQAAADAAQAAFRHGDFAQGAEQAIGGIHRALAAAFPAQPGEVRRNELADSPVVLS